ncbi:MAG: carbohydrate porin [Deltaproteobacteria bacterium]|nr:carbohydrate porin [Deltaproteobacteria bacterium]
MLKKVKYGILVIMLSLCLGNHAVAYEITDKLSIGGILAGVYQYQSVSSAPGFDDRGRGALVFQPEVCFTPTENDEIFAKLGFGTGNGLKEGVSPFMISSWAADKEDDVEDINGRNRDYLLTAWYKHTFNFGQDHALGVTGGLIDATDYVDGNAYSNDEFTQFMNEALVNGPNGFFPSYDWGGALEWELGPFALKFVGMNVNENDDGRKYNWYGTELEYTSHNALGEGHYRVILDWTSKDFNNPSGDKKESLSCFLLSFDQQLGDVFGVWVRLGKQDDHAAISCEKLYSGGIDINGRLWGRGDDNMGIGFAHLRDGNLDVDQTHVLEIYARFMLSDIFALTADLQYMKDEMKQNDSPRGFIYGLRLTAEF